MEEVKIIIDKSLYDSGINIYDYSEYKKDGVFLVKDPALNEDNIVFVANNMVIFIPANLFYKVVKVDKVGKGEEKDNVRGIDIKESTFLKTIAILANKVNPKEL